jgi:hypothetical protein
LRTLALDLLSMLRPRWRRSAAAPAAADGGDRVFFEDSPLPMWVFDPETLRFLDVNATALDQYGYTRAEFLGMTIADIRPPEDLGRLFAAVQSPHRQTREKTGLFRHRKKSGEVITVEIVSHEIRHRGRRARLVLANDVTERLKLEEQVRQSQKMDAVGQLAGGVAHDFNNLLTVIAATTELALEDEALSAETRADLAEVRRATARAADLTRQLLALGRKQTLQPRLIDVNAAVMDAEKMLRRLIREDVALELSLANPLGPVFADRAQLEIALLNLVVNARDAMPDGGRIVIATREVLPDDEELAGELFRGAASPCVAITVRDTGHGMTAEVLERAFEPFFTTKPLGKGTGLGLATVYGIAKQSGGTIRLASAPGSGTAATIYLPRLAGEPNGGSEAKPVEPPGGGSEFVLVVEDEPAVRAVVERVLTAAGYRVLSAASGGEALALLSAPGHKVDLVVTDVIMPEMGGSQLAARLRADWPSVRVLFTSGYAADEFGSQRVPPNALLLHKPFTPDALVRAVRAALDERR